jgi:ferric-dicitrate binding protein FerR (iron transport regulator)
MDLLSPGPEDFLCDESFQRFCRGEEQADILYWEHQVKMNPDQAIVIAEAKRLFEVLSGGQGHLLEQLTSLQDAIVRREQLKEVLRSRPAVSPAIQKAKVVTFNRRTLIGYAASVVVLITAGALAYVQYGNKEVAALRHYEYYTAAHNHKTVMLPDGSVVMLNENSHLSVSKNFDSRHREVSITGEAFFDIKTDASHPFLVHTRAYGIRVLGTSFNVRSYPGEKGTETGLITGKLEIIPNEAREAHEKVVLRPSEKFIMEQHIAVAGSPAVAGKGTLSKLRIDTATQQVTETSWMRRKIEINNETLEQIAARLQSWYGVTIIFSNEAVKQYRYTATFNDETIFKVLQYLQQSYPFTYKIEQDSIVITQN